MRRLLGAAALLAAAGCATMEPARGHAEVAALVRERAGAQTGWGEGPPAEGPVSARVDELLRGGLTPERAVDIALINNPTLAATYEELGISQADLLQAGLLSNPSLGGSLGFPGQEGIIEYEASLAFGFLDLFVLPLRKKVAKDQFDADVLKVAHEALSVTAEVRKAVAQLQAQEQLVELARQALLGADAAAELTARQRAAGNVTELALATERAAAEQAKLALAQEELSLLEQREQLTRLLGLWGPRTQWTLAQRLPALPAQDGALERLESRAIRQRLDVDAARKQTLLFQNAVELARTTRLFGLVEVGVHVHQDPDGPRLLGPTLSLELPIFDQRQAVVGKLEAQLRQAQRRLDALSVQVRSEVRLAHGRLRLARLSAQHHHDQLLPLRASALQQTQLQYNGMQLGLTELLAAKQAQLDAQRGYLLSLRDYWVARAELERVLGANLAAAPATPLPAPEEPKPHDHAGH